MRLTQGAFSFLPDLTDAQILKQVEYCISKGWAISIEWTDDPHPRNNYWELWGLPLFDIKDPAAVMFELAECRKLNPAGYIKLQAFDGSGGVYCFVLYFFATRPANEPGFYLSRTDDTGRFQKYAITSYSVNAAPAGSRY